MKKIVRTILLVLLALVVIGTFVYLYVKAQPKPVVYRTEKPLVTDIIKKTVATGRIEPRDEVEIKPQISGIINEIYREAGEVVNKGDVIATIRVIPEMGSLNSAENRVNIANLEYEQAKMDFERVTKLYEKSIISQEEFEKERLTYNKMREEHLTAIENLEIVRDGISKKTASLGNTQIRATVTGMILDVPIKVGNSVIQSNTFNDGTTICKIADMRDMLFVGSIDESEVGRLSEGLPLVLTIGALQDMKFDATLEYVSPKGKDENGAVMFEIKAAAEIPDSVTVRAGYSANAEIILMSRKNVLAVPEGVVEMKDGESYVYVLDETVKGKEQKFEKVKVETGISDGINIEIKSGIEPDMQLRSIQM